MLFSGDATNVPSVIKSGQLGESEVGNCRRNAPVLMITALQAVAV
jgi:hypothetical protein